MDLTILSKGPSGCCVMNRWLGGKCEWQGRVTNILPQFSGQMMVA